MRAVCIGDSITAGQMLGSGDLPWTAYLADSVQRGVPGDTTRRALERFPTDVQSVEADMVIIQLGHNDANRWQTDRGLPRVSLAAFVANLEEMLDRAAAFGMEPVLCTLTPSFRPEPHPADCRAYDAALRAVAARRGVRLADASGIGADLMLDGLHLSADGHLAYADIVMAALR
ncbi:MAG TPA: SGNH/GDSL hydrolase family protein [Phycisphaerae bacterium]|nr:SGNH/GDSL hydrolase family protein [Phycisphaerae bacterium]